MSSGKGARHYANTSANINLVVGGSMLGLTSKFTESRAKDLRSERGNVLTEYPILITMLAMVAFVSLYQLKPKIEEPICTGVRYLSGDGAANAELVGQYSWIEEAHDGVCWMWKQDPGGEQNATVLFGGSAIQ